MTRALRSWRNFGKRDRDGFIHRSWIQGTGLPDHVLDGRPVIGIANTWSELVGCQAGLRDLAEFVKRGVWEAGGVPVEFPAMSLAETQMRPTAMLYRNLLAMEAEESIRANPIDGVVLLCGCDKTTPGLLMGAASVDLPTIVVSSGPMLNGTFRGEIIGSGTDVWRFSEMVRAGEMTMDDFMAAAAGNSRSVGVCNTMGTASTLSSLTEAMGVSLPGNGALPAVDARRRALAHRSGGAIVRLVQADVPLSRILTRDAFENAILVHAALGGSTNAVIHLLALAGRLGTPLTLEDFDSLGREVPLLVDLRPSGRFLMEDFAYAGGVGGVLHRLRTLIRRDALSVSGRTIGEEADDGRVWRDEVIGSLEAPVGPASGVWVLKGDLCPDGAVIKPSAATPELLRHTGPAVVFDSIEDLRARIDDPDLPVTPDAVLVLKGCGPKGYPGMAEVGNMPLPQKILKAGVRDMVRLSDARMSGTAYGTVVLHIAPEAAAGGPLALVETGDEIALDGPNRRLDLRVEPSILARRSAQHTIPATGRQRPAQFDRGWGRLYVETVQGADRGCDLDFLVGRSGGEVARESH